MSFNVDGLNYCAYAHAAVREVACTSCGSGKGARCLSNAKNPVGYAVLSPSRSHRPRFEAYARHRAARG